MELSRSGLPRKGNELSNSRTKGARNRIRKGPREDEPESVGFGNG